MVPSSLLVFVLCVVCVFYLFPPPLRLPAMLLDKQAHPHVPRPFPLTHRAPSSLPPRLAQGADFQRGSTHLTPCPVASHHPYHNDENTSPAARCSALVAVPVLGAAACCRFPPHPPPPPTSARPATSLLLLLLLLLLPNSLPLVVTQHRRCTTYERATTNHYREAIAGARADAYHTRGYSKNSPFKRSRHVLCRGFGHVGSHSRAGPTPSRLQCLATTRRAQ